METFDPSASFVPLFPALRMSTHRDAISQLDARHDELIRKLDALNADIERVLAEFAQSRAAAPQVASEQEDEATQAPIRHAA